MGDEEYDAFLRYLFDEYIQPRLPLVRRHHHHFEDEFQWAFERLRRAKQVTDVIYKTHVASEEPYRTLAREALASIIGDVESGVRFHNSVAEESGVMEVLDTHFDALAVGLRYELMPPQEGEVLTSLGFPELAQHLPGIVYMVRTTAGRPGYGTNELPVSRRLSDVADRLDRSEKEHREIARPPEEGRPEEPQRRKSRRWFKGLGQILQGAVLSIADIALAAGLLHMPVTPETRTWGALASATAGVGTLLSGVGDLRGE